MKDSDRCLLSYQCNDKYIWWRPNINSRSADPYFAGYWIVANGRVTTAYYDVYVDSSYKWSYDTLEVAMAKLDSVLVDQGYILLTKEQTGRIEALI